MSNSSHCAQGGEVTIHQILVYSCSENSFIFIFNELWRQMNMKLTSEAEGVFLIISKTVLIICITKH